MKLHVLILALLAFVPTHQSLSATYLGTFDWDGRVFEFGPGRPISGSAAFTYDSASNYGSIQNFVPNFSTYTGDGDWYFTIGRSPFFPPSINSWDDLINFPTNRWELAPALQVNGTLGDPSGSWGVSDHSFILNPPGAAGSAYNFQQVPEPSVPAFAALGAIIFLHRRKRPYHALQRL